MGTGFSRLQRSISSMRPRRPLELPPRSFSTQISNPAAPDLGPLEADLRTYEDTYNADGTLRRFDSALQDRTSRAMNSIRDGFDAGSLSLDSLKQVTEWFLATDESVVNLLLQNKSDIWKNKELYDLVEDYLLNSSLTLEFCTKLDSCLKRATHIEAIIKVVHRNFQEENSVVPENGSVRSYSKTLEKLENLRTVGDPFTEDFFEIFRSVCSNQRKMLKRLRMKKKKIGQKLAKLNTYKRISNAIFVAIFATILVCSVVAAALAAPPVVTALVAAATVPMGSMGTWISSLWKKYEKDLKVQMEAVDAMQLGTCLVVKDIQNIRVLMDKFRIGIEALKTNAEFGVQGAEEQVLAAVEEIMKEVVSFSTVIRDLTDHASRCSRDTSIARSLILRRMINESGGSLQPTGMFL